jgi:hypothetical protein
MGMAVVVGLGLETAESGGREGVAELVADLGEGEFFEAADGFLGDAGIAGEGGGGDLAGRGGLAAELRQREGGESMVDAGGDVFGHGVDQAGLGFSGRISIAMRIRRDSRRALST